MPLNDFCSFVKAPRVWLKWHVSSAPSLQRAAGMTRPFREHSGTHSLRPSKTSWCPERSLLDLMNSFFSLSALTTVSGSVGGRGEVLKKISGYIQEQNEKIYAPRGLLLTDPVERGMRVIEVSVFEDRGSSGSSPSSNVSSGISQR
ncbi:uncharacterized protein [Salvelinus alpinus]|uniref:uncharacterized protein isoform X2 n=1 Tax=Salvelinus alpinus TaxID=8036 RepID=UPI0039FC6037